MSSSVFRSLRRLWSSHFHRLAATAVALILTLSALSPLASAGLAQVAYAAPRKPPIPYKINPSEVHPGSLVVAFQSSVRRQSNRHVSAASAAAKDVDATNKILDGLGTTNIVHLFTNLPADKLNAMRAKAMAATGAYVTDFTQLYQVKFNPSINSADAVNRLLTSPLVTAASPDWIYRQPPKDPAPLTAAQAAAALKAPRASLSAPKGPSTVSLPPNYSYRTDGQSILDAASDDVTGAAAMLASGFHQQPGQGEIVTNISLGDINDSSTVLDGGQRYLEQAGYPKIPVWLSSCTNPNPTGAADCAVVLDPTATTQDDQGDLGEVMLDFSVMAPPPLGDPREVNPPPAGLGELLGEAYGAQFRLINPVVNSTPDFLAAFLGAAVLQSPPPDIVTASIGPGFGIGGFSDYYFEQETIIHDIVSMLVNGGDIFVTISAGDGQFDTTVAMNPNGITGPTNFTHNPADVVDINDPALWANPNYSYGLTVEPEVVLDSGANDAGGTSLNDIFNNSPWNLLVDPVTRHSQPTTETRWTGQQDFNSGNGSRVNLAAPADNVLMLAQVEVDGVPVNPVATFPRLTGGTSASSPEIAGAAAVVRQTARLLGHPLTARQTRDLLVDTARPNIIPSFDLNNDSVGPVLDLTAGVQALVDKFGGGGQPSIVRMTVAERKTALTNTDFLNSFYTDTPQDPAAHTATIDLSQGLVAPSSRTNETVGASGDNVNYPITFAADAAFVPGHNAHYSWSLQMGSRHADVPGNWFNDNLPYVRLLPVEIFGLLGQPVTAAADRVVQVTVHASGSASLTENVTFKGQPNGSYSHAIPPTFNPVFRPVGNGLGQLVGFAYDLRGLRDGNGHPVDGGILLVSDIDRAVPQAFPDNDLNAHGFQKKLNGLVGIVTLSASDLRHGVGTYGIAIRGTSGGQPVADSTSPWVPLRYAPDRQQLPATPKIQAVASLLNGTAPLFYEIADTEPGASTQFSVTYDVRPVDGAKNAIIEFSAPTINFADALFFTGNFGPTNTDVNNFTNPNGDRFDTGDNFGQPGSVARVSVPGTHGVAMLDGAAIGLSIPTGKCDSTYQVRVFATNSQGHIVGVAGNGSILSYSDFSRPGCP